MDFVELEITEIQTRTVQQPNVRMSAIIRISIFYSKAELIKRQFVNDFLRLYRCHHKVLESSHHVHYRLEILS